MFLHVLLVLLPFYNCLSKFVYRSIISLSTSLSTGTSTNLSYFTSLRHTGPCCLLVSPVCLFVFFKLSYTPLRAPICPYILRKLIFSNAYQWLCLYVSGVCVFVKVCWWICFPVNDCLHCISYTVIGPSVHRGIPSYPLSRPEQSYSLPEALLPRWLKVANSLRFQRAFPPSALV